MVCMQRVRTIGLIIRSWAIGRMLMLCQYLIEIMILSSHHCYVEALCIAGERFVGRMVNIRVTFVILASYDAHGAKLIVGITIREMQIAVERTVPNVFYELPDYVVPAWLDKEEVIAHVHQNVPIFRHVPVDSVNFSFVWS